MQGLSEDKHKPFAADCQKEINRQIFLARLRRKYGLLDALINDIIESNDTGNSTDDNNKTYVRS